MNEKGTEGETKMEAISLTLYPLGAPDHCTCEVRRDEHGMIILPDLAQCPFTITAHKEAIQRAIERIQAVSPKPTDD